MWFSTFIFANLLGRPARSLLTLSGIAIAVAAVVSLLGIVRGFEASLMQLYRGRGIEIIVQQAGRLQITASVLPERLARRVAEVEGVAAVYPGLFEVVSLIDDDLMGVVVQGWPVDSEPVSRLNIIAGGRFSSPDAAEVIVGRRLAAALDVQVGDRTEVIEGEPLTVVGVFDSANVFDDGSMFAPLPTLQRLMFREGEATILAVVADNAEAENLRLIADRISRLGRNGKAGGLVDGVRIEAEVAEEVARRSTEIRVARSFAWLTSAIAVLIGSVGMLNTMMMAVFERTREIAMLRALGWRRRRVIAMVLGEATLLCLAGAAVGIAVAWVAVHWLASMPAAGRLVAGDISLQVMIQGVLLALVLGLLGGAYPAWAAVRLAPVEGLRHD